MAGPGKPYAFVAPLVLAAVTVALVTLVFARRSESPIDENPLDPRPAQIRALVDLADASALIGNWPGARKALEKASALDPDDPVLQGRLQEAREEERREALLRQAAAAPGPEKAESLAQARAIREEPALREEEISVRVRTYSDQAAAARQSGNLTLAAELFRQALSLAPDPETERQLEEIQDAQAAQELAARKEKAAVVAAEAEALLVAKKVRSAAAKFREALELLDSASWRERLAQADEYRKMAEQELGAALALYEKRQWQSARESLDRAALFDAENEGVVRMAAEVRAKALREGMVRVEAAGSLPAFWIDRLEVSEGQYAAYLKAQRLAVPRRWKDGVPPADGALPMMGVSALDAERYAAWAGKRLPTEDEWLAAAGAGDGRAWAWGSDWKDGLANVSSDSPRAAGAQPANASPCGALDMSGNVAEWTSSSTEKGRILKGGSFLFPREACRLEWRWEEAPDVALPGFGFRCVVNE